MKLLYLLLLLVALSAQAQHVQILNVKYDKDILTAEYATEIAKWSAYKHRQDAGHRVRLGAVSAFNDTRPELADWNLRQDRVDYLYHRFYKPINYMTTLVIGSPMVLNGKTGSAGAAYICDRHGGVAATFIKPPVNADQAMLIATHELGHIFGSFHTPDWFQDIMHPDAQRVYFNTYGGFYRDTYSFNNIDGWYDLQFKYCNKESASTKFSKRRKSGPCFSNDFKMK